MESPNCRLCSDRKVPMIGIFSEEDIERKISSYLSLEVRKDDGLSTSICILCYGKLDNFHKFVVNVHKVQEEMTATIEIKEIFFEAINLESEIYYDDETEMPKDEIKSNMDTDFQPLLSSDRNPVTEDCCSMILLQNEQHEEILTHSPNDSNKKFGRSVSFNPKVNVKKIKFSVTNRRHETENTSSLRFICPTCRRKFQYKSKLRQHMLVHTNEKPFHCEFEGCDKNFLQKSHLKIHVRIHNGVKPYKCPYSICQETFTQSHQVYNHICSHIGKSDIPAEIQSYLNSHKITLQVCAICGKKFNDKHHFKNHKLMHIGMKPYNCTVEGCGQKFNQKSNLKKHMLMHQEKKDHKCPLNTCCKTFVQKMHLYCHICNHLNEKNCPEEIRSHFQSLKVKHYICATCGKIYIQRTVFEKHILSHN